MNQRNSTQGKVTEVSARFDLSGVKFSRGEEGPKLLRGIHSEIREVAQAVESATGWSVDLSKIRCEGVSAGELARRYAEDLLRRTGVRFVYPSSEQSRKAFDAMVTARCAETAAIFVSVEGAILFNEELPSTFSRDSVRSSLFHELVHLAQFQRYPEFWRSTDELHQKTVLLSKHGGDVPHEAREARLDVARDRFQARKAFLEAHAAVLQAEFVRKNDLHPARGSELFTTVTEEAALVAVGSSLIVAQFVSSALVVKEAIERDSLSIDTIFENQALCEVVFGASNPRASKKRASRFSTARPSAS